MFEEDVKVMAEWHLKDKGLDVKGWKLKLRRSGSKANYGRCSVSNRGKQIFINLTYTDYSSDENVKDLILHEIAHAIEYERYGRMTGHSDRWRRMAREVGAEPRALSYDYGHIQEGLVGFCPNNFCDYETWRFTRRPRRTYICPDCKLKLEWENT